MPTSNLEARRDVLTALPNDAVRPPVQPVDSYLQEARNLHAWSLADRDALEKGGVAWEDVESLPDRIAALEEAETAWLSARFSHSDAETRWKEAESDGYALRDELVASMRHAFRKDARLVEKVRGIAEGRGDADMIQDLNDIAVLGTPHLDLLERIGVTAADLDEAARMSDELAPVLAALEAEQRREKAQDLRNRAFTHLREAVTEIRECGTFAFRKDPQRAKRYTSAYMRRHRGKGGKGEVGDDD